MPVSRTEKCRCSSEWSGASVACVESNSAWTKTSPFSVNLMRVAQQIHQHLPQPQRIALDRRRNAVVHLADQIEIFFGGLGGQQVERLLDARAQIKRPRVQFHLARLDFRKIQDVVDDRQQRFAAGVDGFQIAALVGRQRRFHQQADHGDDAVHRRADFVAHGREKFRLGAHAGLGMAARLDQFLVAPDQFILPPPHFQRRQQPRAQERGVRLLADAVQRAEFKRTQLHRRVVRVGKRDEQRDPGQRLALDPPQQFRPFRATPNPAASVPAAPLEAIAAPRRRCAPRRASRRRSPRGTTVLPPIGNRRPPAIFLIPIGSWCSKFVSFSVAACKGTLNTIFARSPMRFLRMKIAGSAPPHCS